MGKGSIATGLVLLLAASGALAQPARAEDGCATLETLVQESMHRAATAHQPALPRSRTDSFQGGTFANLEPACMQRPEPPLIFRCRCQCTDSYFPMPMPMRDPDFPMPMPMRDSDFPMPMPMRDSYSTLRPELPFACVELIGSRTFSGDGGVHYFLRLIRRFS